ncbi:MAG: C40 family peptidase [Oscillospiraceae bacterium]|jgi:cell wall-associated NlpC family hydrolase|nr:C40 family peptidase [Oscillospiraceae bacterium]
MRDTSGDRGGRQSFILPFRLIALAVLICCLTVVSVLQPQTAIRSYAIEPGENAPVVLPVALLTAKVLPDGSAESGSADEPVAIEQGGRIEYTITVSSPGGSADGLVSTLLPEGLAYIESVPAGVKTTRDDRDLIVWESAFLPSGDTVYRVTAEVCANRLYINTAEVEIDGYVITTNPTHHLAAAPEPDMETEETPEPDLEPEEAPPPEETPIPPADPQDEIEIENPPVEAGDAEDGIDWEYPPGWADSGQQYLNGNILLAEQMRRLELELKDRVQQVREESGLRLSAPIIFDRDNMCDILAIYAVRNAMAENFPYDIVFENGGADALLSLYWEMTEVSASEQYVNGASVSVIYVKRLSCEDYIEKCAPDQSEQALLAPLVSEPMRALVAAQLSGSILAKVTADDFQRITARIPRDISAERRAVLLAATALEGKVQYFWGGKSYYVGWDERWGNLRTVSSEGSKSYGTVRPLGLDCSGFVSWAFINAGGDKAVLKYIGNGTANQWRNSQSVAWHEAQPGDLVFYKTPTAEGVDHVGIICGFGEDGRPLVVHCSSSGNGVVITGANGFHYVRRPYLYQ